MKKHNFKSELKGIVGLVKDFKSEALLPLFEAVVNSIHAISDAGKTEEGIISRSCKTPIRDFAGAA